MRIQKAVVFLSLILCIGIAGVSNAFAQSLLNAEELKISQSLARDALGNAKLSLEDAEAIQGAFKRDLTIPFGYIEDGCQARAHLIVLKLREMKISSHKILIQGDLHPSSAFGWKYHIAPFIQITDQNKKQWRVIDPSLSKNPLTSREWKDLSNPVGEFSLRRVSWRRYVPGLFKYILSSEETEKLRSDLKFYRSFIYSKTGQSDKIYLGSGEALW